MGTKRIPCIAKWKPTKASQIFSADGKLMRVQFSKVLDNPKLDVYGNFMIEKVSIQNQLSLIVHYLNYFVNFYDEDHEFLVALLHIKMLLDEDKVFTTENMEDFIAYIYKVIITPSIVAKIKAMTEKNYTYDIEAGSDSQQSNFKRGASKHLESLEFTNQHAKALLSISVGTKMIGPLMAHYFALNLFKVSKETIPIYGFFRPLFEVFKKTESTSDNAMLHMDMHSFFIYNEKSDGFDKYDEDGNLIDSCILAIDEEVAKDASGTPIICTRTYFAEYDSLAKLYAYVKAKVAECIAANTAIFKQREIFGNDHFTVTRDFLRRVVISDNIIKFDYNKNIIGFIKTIVRQQLGYFIKEAYCRNLTEVRNKPDDDGLSGGDKMLINQAKRDEGAGIISELNTIITVERIVQNSGFSISEDEITFYCDHHHPHEIQIYLIRNYFAKYFGCVRDEYQLTNRQYMTLLIVLKKKLMVDLGYEDTKPMTPDEIREKIEHLKADGFEYPDDAYIENYVRPAALVYLLSGNLTDRLNNRLIRNKQFTAKLEESYTYQYLMETKFKYLKYVQPDALKRLVSSLISSRFTYVEYDHPELLDVVIQYSDDKISNEFLYFLCQI